MKDAFKRWLADNTLLPGVLACGVRFPDRESFSQCYSDALKSDQLRDVWQAVADASAQLGAKPAPPQRHRWVFESAHIHVAVRSDGVSLGVLTRPDASAAAVGAVLESFLAFAPA